MKGYQKILRFAQNDKMPLVQVRVNKMGYYRTKGIIIKEVNTGEADKMITILTPDNGKISVFAKGARRPRSRLTAGSQFLCYSDFILFKNKEIYTINSCDVIESFYGIRDDIVKLTYSAHMIDLINDVTQENQQAARILKLFLNTMHMLVKTQKSPELLTRIFELKLLTILGYAPYVKGCLVCAKDDLSDMSFSFKKCGFVCSRIECGSIDPGATDISPGAARTIRYIVHSKMSNLFKFDLSPEVLNELRSILKRYLRERLEREYTKLDFLKAIDFIK